MNTSFNPLNNTTHPRTQAKNLPRDLIPSPQASSDEIEAGEVTPNEPSLNYRIAANNTIALIDKTLLSDDLTDTERQNLQNRRAKLLKSLGAYGLEAFPETTFAHEEQPTTQDLEANAAIDNQIIEALKQPLQSESHPFLFELCEVCSSMPVSFVEALFFCSECFALNDAKALELPA